MSVEYRGFSLMEDGEGSAPGSSATSGPSLTSNQVRMLQARDAECCSSESSVKRALWFVGILSFIALIVGSVAVSKADSEDNSSSSSSSSVCPYGDITLGDEVFEHNGHYYQLIGDSTATMNWPEAVRDANSRCYNNNQGYLANIESAGEQNFLFYLWRNSSKYESGTTVNAWIGAADMHEEGIFEWVGPGKLTVGTPFFNSATNTPIDGAYTDWASGEPSESGSEDCVEMRNGHGNWNDRACYGNNPFFFVEFGEPE